MIPRITHQIYFGGFDALPEADRLRITAFHRRNPSWEHRFYDRRAAESWLAENCGQDIQDAYHKIDAIYYAARAVFLRYLLCERHGGVYLDVKSEASRPLDEVLRPDDTYLLSQWNELRGRPAGQGGHADLADVPGDEFVNWYIAASAGHPFLRAVIERVMSNIASYDVWRSGVGRIGVLRTTGPIAYTKAIFPILDRFPHRFADMEADLGFCYSRFGDHKSHRVHYGRHYETMSDLVIKSGPLTHHAARLWFSRIQPEMQRTRRRVRKVATMLLKARP